MMTFRSNDPHLFRWRRLSTSKTPANKIQLKKGDIHWWRKQVETASKSAVPEVCSNNNSQSGKPNFSVPLQSCDQLKDHDDAYNEAQALLWDWLGSKLEPELGIEEKDGLMCSAERRIPAGELAPPSYCNFDELYNHLAEEDDHCDVKRFLQDLMGQKGLDCAVVEELALDFGSKRQTFKNPIVSMEARHQQARENRARREAELQKQQRQREAQLGAVEQERKQRQAEEKRKKQKMRRQEDMVQQEMVRLRRQMEATKDLDPLLRQRERVEDGAPAQSLQRSLPLYANTKQQQENTAKLYKEQKIYNIVNMHNLKCQQRHFSRWYTVVLDRRLRMGKATALCDWRRKLRAWRAWRAVLWEEKKEREVVRTEEELRGEHRQNQLATESDRRRLLQRCLQDWRLWFLMERDRREFVAQQQKTRRKMAELICAASTGKLRPTETTSCARTAASAVMFNHWTAGKEDPHPSDCAAHYELVPCHEMMKFSQPLQVSQWHVAPTAAEISKARQNGLGHSKSAASPGGRFENRHAAQQHIITKQRQLLKKQQEEIARLKEEQTMISLKMDAEKKDALSQLSIPGASRLKHHDSDPYGKKASKVTGDSDSVCTPPRKPVTHQTRSHPIIKAMEARARQRAERKREMEELKRKKEEEKLAEMKAAQEQRQREDEMEKRKAAERKREEKRLEKLREEEKQRQLLKHQELQEVACQHYNRTLLLQKGLEPWKRLIHLRKANTQLAKSHYNLFLLRRCTLGWQKSAKESQTEREASADQLHQLLLLRRGLNCWKRLKDWQMIQEERAACFYRKRILKRFLLALADHLTQERLLEWDNQKLAQRHSNRRVLRQCFLAWRQFPYLQRLEKVREERREKLGRKVTEVLPDFCSHPL